MAFFGHCDTHRHRMNQIRTEKIVNSNGIKVSMATTCASTAGYSWNNNKCLISQHKELRITESFYSPINIRHSLGAWLRSGVVISGREKSVIKTKCYGVL